MDKFDLERFVKAQDKGMYQFVLDELRGGRKRTHWMWFMFPQLKQLGFSPKAKFFGISGREEAETYMRHPLLASHLRELTQTVAGLPTDNPEEIFGALDSMKFRSCMTLFDAVSPVDIFRLTLDKFYGAKGDERTLELLSEHAMSE